MYIPIDGQQIGGRYQEIDTRIVGLRDDSQVAFLGTKTVRRLVLSSKENASCAPSLTTTSETANVISVQEFNISTASTSDRRRPGFHQKHRQFGVMPPSSNCFHKALLSLMFPFREAIFTSRVGSYHSRAWKTFYPDGGVWLRLKGTDFQESVVIIKKLQHPESECCPPCSFRRPRCRESGKRSGKQSDLLPQQEGNGDHGPKLFGDWCDTLKAPFICALQLIFDAIYPFITSHCCTNLTKDRGSGEQQLQYTQVEGGDWAA